MKKLIFAFFVCLVISNCTSRSDSSSCPSDKDSIITVFGSNKRFEIPLDSFLQIKDSFVYAEEEGNWLTKELYKWNYVYPDCITVAYTIKGEFIDSAKAVRRDILYNENGEAYSPAYHLESVVGDYIVYDVNGKYIKFVCVDTPHSGRGEHQYEP